MSNADDQTKKDGELTEDDLDTVAGGAGATLPMTKIATPVVKLSGQTAGIIGETGIIGEKGVIGEKGTK